MQATFASTLETILPTAAKRLPSTLDNFTHTQESILTTSHFPMFAHIWLVQRTHFVCSRNIRAALHIYVYSQCVYSVDIEESKLNIF